MQASDTAAATHPALQHHFDNMEQQREASSLGMWIFLATEIMFFGGLMLAYLIYRMAYFHAFAAGSESMTMWLGAVNTAVLICSSLTVALSVHAAQEGQRKLLVGLLIATMLLGCVFLGIKAKEYHDKYVEHHVPGPTFSFHAEHDPPVRPDEVPNVQLFFSLYFAMTGLHALHMVIGIGLFMYLTYKAWQGTYGPDYHTPVENFGLYWHFVDIVWIFLFPLLYLVGHAK